MRKIQRERVAGATERELGKLDEPHDERSDDDPDRDRMDAEERIAELSEQDDDEVVDKRGRRAREELTVRVEDSRRERREAHEDGRQQHEPGEVHGEGDLLRVVERRDERRYDVGRGDPHDDREADEQEQDEVHDARGDVPRLVLALPREVAREYRDERGGERARDHETEDRIGDLERRPERVELGRLAEMRPDDRQAQPAEDAARNEGDDHDRRGARDRHRQPDDFEASGIVRIYASQETQALRPQTHPPDPATDVDADDRPVRRAYRRAHGARRHRQGHGDRGRHDCRGGKRPRQGGEAGLDSQEQRPPATKPYREGGYKGEEKDLDRARGQRLIAYPRGKYPSL